MNIRCGSLPSSYIYMCGIPLPIIDFDDYLQKKKLDNDYIYW